MKLLKISIFTVLICSLLASNVFSQWRAGTRVSRSTCKTCQTYTPSDSGTTATTVAEKEKVKTVTKLGKFSLFKGDLQDFGYETIQGVCDEAAEVCEPCTSDTATCNTCVANAVVTERKVTTSRKIYRYGFRRYGMFGRSR